MTRNQMRALCLVALTAVIPFGHMLDMGYSWKNPEPWVVTAGFAVIGLILARLSVASRAFGPVFAFVLYWFLDANVYEKGLLLAIPLLAVIFTFAFALRRVEDWALPAATVFAVMFSATAVLKPHAASLTWSGPDPVAGTAVAAAGERPAVLHIILDEFMSPLALPETIPPGHPAQTMLADLAAKGFVVTARAPSINVKTRISISAVMGLTDQDDNFVENPRSDDFSYSVKDNRLFDLLAGQGYDITAVQVNFLELCNDQPEARCATYTRAVDMNAIARLGLPMPTRIKLAFLALYQEYLDQKSMRQVALLDLLANVIAGRDASFGFFSRPLAVVDMLDQISAGDFGPARGQALIAHMLLPHSPYVLNPDCSLKPVSHWTMPLRTMRTPDPAVVYAGYWDQAACTLMRVNRIVDAALAREDMIIVIHGDHGARITEESGAEVQDDLLMTFVATRTPGVPGRLETTPQRLQEVTAAFYTGLFAR